MKIIYITLVLFLTAFSISLKAEVLYCDTELATGVTKENGIWKTSSFVKERYIMNFNSDFTALTYSSSNELDYKYYMSCTEVFRTSPEVIKCIEDVGAHYLLFNKDNLRYQLAALSTASYTKPNRRIFDTSSINFGKCTNF